MTFSGERQLGAMVYGRAACRFEKQRATTVAL